MTTKFLTIVLFVIIASSCKNDEVLENWKNTGQDTKAINYWVIEDSDLPLVHYDSLQLKFDYQFEARVVEDSLTIAYSRLGSIYLIRSAFSQAYACFTKALKTAQLTKSDYDEISALVGRSLVFKLIGDYESSRISYHEAIQKAMQSNNLGRLPHIYFELAKLEILDTIPERALEACNAGIQYLKYDTNSENQNYLRLHLTNTLGLIHFKNYSYNEALNHYKSALSLGQSKNLNFGFIYGNIGEVYEKLEKYDSATLYLKKDIYHSLNINDIRSARQAALTLSQVYLKAGENNNALRYLSVSDSLSNQIKEEGALPKNSRLRLNIISKLKKESDQLAAYKEYLIQMDTVVANYLNDTKIQIGAILTIQKAFNNINKLEQERKHQAQRNGYLAALAIAIVTLLALIVLALVARASRMRQKNKIGELTLKTREAELELLKKEKQLQEKEIELQNQLTKSHERQLEISKKSYQQLAMAKEYKIELKNKLINHITKALQPIDRFPEDIRKKIDDVFRTINKIEDNSLATYIDREDESGSFIPALQHDYPDLTPEELKLCTYIRLNMSTKEIARLKMISLPGVSKSRNRLRKKLGLNPSDDLLDFLMSY